MRLRSFVIGACASLSLLLGAGVFQAQAAACNFTNGSGNDAWSNAANWSCAAAPGSGDTVTVTTGAVYLDGVASVSISGLSVSAGAQVNALGNALTVTSTSVVTGAVTSTVGALTFQGQGGTPVPLTIAATGSVSSMAGLISASTTTIVAGGVLADNDGNIYISGNLTNAGTIYLPAGVTRTLRLDGNLTNTATIPVRGTFNFAGAGSTLSPGPASFNNVTVAKTSGSATFTTRPIIVGTLALTGGAGTMDISAAGGCTVGGATTIASGSTLLVGAGTSTFANVTDTGTFTLDTGGSATTTGAFTVDPGTGVLNLGLLPSGRGVLDVGTTLTNNNTVNAYGGTVYLRGNFVNAGTFGAGTSVFVLTGPANQNIGGVSFYSLMVDKSAGTVTKSASATLGGDFTTVGAARVELNGFNLVVNGNTNVGSGTAVTSTSGSLVFGDAPAIDTTTNAGSVSSTSGLILFSSALTAGASSYIQVNTGALTFNGTVSNAGSIYLNAGIASSTQTFTNQAATGIFNLGSGTVTSTAVFTNNGQVIGGTGTFDAQADYLGNGSFVNGGSLFKFSGTASRNSNLANAYNFQNNVTSNGVVTMTRDLAIANTYGSIGANTLNAATFVLNLAGVASIGTGTVVTSTTGTINFTGLSVANVGKIGTLSGNLRFEGALMNTGEIHVGSGNASTTGLLAAFNNNTGGTLFLESGHTTSTVNMNNNGGTINGGTGTLDLTGPFTDTAGIFTALGSTLVLSGTTDLTLPGYTYYNLIAGKTGNGTVTAGGATVVGGYLTLSGSTKFQMNGSSLNVTGATNLAASTAVTSTTGVLTFAGVINAGTVTSTSANIAAVNFTNTGFLGTNTGNILISGNLTNAGGTLNAPVAAATIGLRVSGDFNNTGALAFNHNGGALVLDGASGATITAVPTVYTLSITKTGNAQVGVAGSDLSVLGNFTASGANGLNLTSRSLTVAGLATIGGINSVSSTSGALSFGILGNSGLLASGTGLIRVTGLLTNSGLLAITSGAMTLAALTNTGNVDFGSGVATTTGSVINNAGVISIGSAHVTSTATWTNNPTATINGGTGVLDFNDANFIDGGGIFTPSTGTVLVSGSTGSAVAGVTYANLVISKTSGASVTFGGSPTVSGVFTTVGSGHANLAANSFTLNGSSVIGSGTSVTSTSGSLIFGDNASVDTVSNSGSISSGIGLVKFVSALTNQPASQVQVTTGAISFDGTVSNAGSVLVGAGSASTTNAVYPFTNVSGGLLSISGSGYVTTTGPIYNNAGAIMTSGGTGTFIFANNFSNSGTFTPGTDVYFSGSASATSSGATNFTNVYVDKTGNSTLTFATTPTLSGTLVTSGSHHVELNALSLTVGGAATIGTGTSVTSTSGNLLFAGVTNVGSVSSTSGLVRASGTFTNSGSLATTAGAIRLVALTNTGTVSFGAGMATTTGAVTNNSSGVIYVQSAYVTSTAGWTNNSGATLNGGSGTLDFNNTGTFINNAGAAFTAGTGRVMMSGTGDAVLSGATYNNFTLGKVSGTVTMASSTTIGGALTTADGGTLNSAATNLSITGISTIGSGTTVTSTSGVLVFTGAVGNSGSIGTISGNQSYAAALTNSGSLHLGSGSATTTAGLINSGTLYGETGVLSVASTWTNAGTFNSGSGTVNLVSSSGQTIPAALTFYDLNVRTTGGAATSTGYTSVSGTFTVVTSTTFDVSTFTLNAPNGYNNAGTVVVGSGGRLIHPNTAYSFTSGSGGAISSVAGGSNVVFLTLQDANRNLLGGTAETINVTAGTGSDTETITLTETGPSTGIFRNATGVTLSGACSPTVGNGTFESYGDGFFSSAYADAYDASDTRSPSKAFTVLSPSSCSGGGGGGGGGGAGSGSPFVPLASTLPVSSSQTPVVAVTPPAVVPPPVPPPVPPVVAPPASGVRFTGVPTTIVTGQSLRFTYAYRNATRSTQSIRIVRELVDARGRVVRTAGGSATVRAGATYSNSVRETVLGTTPAGDYQVRIRILDARGRAIEQSSFPLRITRPMPVRRPAPAPRLPTRALNTGRGASVRVTAPVDTRR